MGVCSSKTDGNKVAPTGKTIPGRPGPAEEKFPKILFIGAGASGKTTVAKQLRILYGKGYDDMDRKEEIPVVHHNIINTMKMLCMQSQAMKMDISQSESRSYILNLQDHQEVMSSTMVKHLRALWSDKAIQQLYEQRYQFDPSIIEHAPWFMEKVADIVSEDYIPTNEDIIRCQVRTTGIVEVGVTLGDSKYIVFDVGGQRFERKKWVHCFKEAGCLVYIAGISGYDEHLLEDSEGGDQLSEELKLFEGVCDMFPTKPIILILNKADILRAKLKTSPKRFLANFPQCTDASPDGALAFIKQHFLNRNKFTERTVQCFTMSAIDAEEVRATFHQIKDLIPRFLPNSTPSKS